MTPITRCRLSGSTNLLPVLSLGDQAMTGVFPLPGESVPRGPLDLLFCPDSGLLQLAHKFDDSVLFGETYGYRSGLNAMMVKHLTEKAAMLAKAAGLKEGDVVVDIGSNDGTFLKALPLGLTRIGVDPLAAKFGKHYYPTDYAIPECFSAESYLGHGFPLAKLVTATAMFYDLNDPVAFCRDVERILAPGGVFHIEVADARRMIERGIYDGICHEHACYYTPITLVKTLRAARFSVIRWSINNVNGGSVWVNAMRSSEAPGEDDPAEWSLTLADLRSFERRVCQHQADLRRLVSDLSRAGKSVVGYGASTKGNVLLQATWGDFTPLPYIADANPEKWGRVTPGTNIPIISEAEMREQRPDYLLVLPFHFREGIMEREKALRETGTRMIFSFPDIEVV